MTDSRRGAAALRLIVGAAVAVVLTGIARTLALRGLRDVPAGRIMNTGLLALGSSGRDAVALALAVVGVVFAARSLGWAKDVLPE